MKAQVIMRLKPSLVLAALLPVAASCCGGN
jgi:hypothetical protein